MSNSSILRKLFPKSLSKEVIEVFAGSPAIKKLGHNDVDDFDYLMILTMCQDFKGELFARGIVFTATDINCAFEQISEAGQFAYRCIVRTKFEARRKCWFGTQRFDLGEAIGAGRDYSEMIALATAQTFAYKAMLKRSSMTYGEENDPEAKPREKLTPNESVRIASYQQRALNEALHKVGIDAQELSEKMSEAVGEPISYEQIAALPRSEFDEAMKIILTWQDLSAQWSAAVVDIKSRKAQPVVAAMDAAPDMTGD